MNAVVHPVPSTMNVICPPNVQAGSQVMVPTPTGQQIMVTVPAGVVSGQQFEVQLTAPAAGAGAPGAGTPEQVLAASIAVAGGEICVKSKKVKKPAGVDWYYEYSIMNAAGAEFAILKYEWQGSKVMVTVALLDGQVVWSDQVTGGSINASAGDSFGQVQARGPQLMNVLTAIVTGGGLMGELTAGGQPVLSIVAPAAPWILPFLILTFCMGVFCLMCMPPTENRIMKGKDCVGTVIVSNGCCDTGSKVVKSNDPAILRASINILAVMGYQDQNNSGG